MSAQHNNTEKHMLQKLAERFIAAASHLDEAIARHPAVSSVSIRFTYLEYLEFASAAEFRRFKAMPLITDEEIASVDMDALCRNLTAA